MCFCSHNEQEVSEDGIEQLANYFSEMDSTDDAEVPDVSIEHSQPTDDILSAPFTTQNDTSAIDEGLPDPSTAQSQSYNNEQLHDENPLQVDGLLADSETDNQIIAHRLYDEADISDDECNQMLGTSATQCDNREPCTIPCNSHLTCSSMSPADLMLLLLKLKHSLSKDATQDIAKLLNVVSDKTVASSSMHNLLKDFITGKNNVEVHHVCKNCGSYIGNVDCDEVHCPLSQCSYRTSSRDSLESGQFFFYLPLAPQLTDLIENHKILDLIKQSPAANGNLCDIIDGDMLKKLLVTMHGSSADRNLTLTFNCDGVPVFKSSSFSIWPILCTVNELPPNIRGDHILIASLWFGAGKPDMNVLLQPFALDCKSLAEKGFSCFIPESGIRISCKATVVVGVCDAVARPLMQNFKQYNGHYGCGFCLNPGEMVERGNGRTRVYLKNDMLLRTIENTRAFVLETIETDYSCMGVKGPSLLSNLPHFDIIHSMVPDYMHCICLGVVRQMANLWFDTKNHDEPFYMGTQVSSIDSQLLAIKPPCSLSRTPRSLSLLKFWKAHEWLSWLLYYSLPVLRNILPAIYYSHWALLVDCTAILLGNNISLAQLVYCERTFVEFVSDFETLYGKQHMSYNVHQLLHITQSVRHWGPLWSHSAFTFEAFNAVLLKMIKGTQGVPMQILNTFCLMRAIPYNVSAVLPNCSEPEALFIQSLTSHRRTIKAAVHVANGVTVLGRPVFRTLKRSHFVALHAVTDTVPHTCAAIYYNKVVHNGEILHSYVYCRNLKRNSYTVQTTDEAYYQIETFLVTNLGFGDNCYAVGRYLRQAQFHFCSRSSPLKTMHIVAVSKVPSALVAIPVTSIVRKCVFMSFRSFDVNFVCHQVHLNDMCV